MTLHCILLDFLSHLDFYEKQSITILKLASIKTSHIPDQSFQQSNKNKLLPNFVINRKIFEYISPKS